MKKSNTRPPVFLVSMILVYLVLLTSALSSGLYARYTATNAHADGARVSGFAFVAESTSYIELIDLGEISNPGDRIEYRFRVANYDGASICEVAQSYTVTVYVEGNMPLTCTLTKNGTASDALQTFSGDKRTLLLEGTFLPAQAEEDSYTLTVEWPADRKDAELANGMAIGKITVTLVSQQTN